VFETVMLFPISMKMKLQVILLILMVMQLVQVPEKGPEILTGTG
jgi:hypothetical protein